MAWLNLQLPLHEELEVEKAVRTIMDSEDLDTLRTLAADTYRAWAMQCDITTQLIQQLADCEVMLAQAGLLPDPDTDYLEWARSLYGAEADGEDAR